MNYREKLFQLLCFMLLGFGSATIDVTQAQTTRSLSGQISLDIAPAIKGLIVEISIRNHEFVVLPPPFGFIRPIQSTVTTNVIITQGEASALYSLTGIVEDPVDYTIQIKCPGCENVIPTQYFSPAGNQFGLSNLAYIEPDDLPVQLALVALTRATISGEILLFKPASKDLDFTLEVAADGNPAFILAANNSLRITKGDHVLKLQISGLARSSNSFLVSLQCRNCSGSARVKRIFDTALSAQSNHSNINFTLIDEGVAIMSPVINLLLESAD
jgi:hypothetical protein